MYGQLTQIIIMSHSQDKPFQIYHHVVCHVTEKTDIREITLVRLKSCCESIKAK